MFTFPVTVPFRHPEGIFPVDLSVPIDGLLMVRPLDKEYSSGVESDTLYSCLPSCELIFEDGRKLPVLETAATINRYLDLSRQIEDFYTAPATPAMNHLIKRAPRQGGEVIPLFGRQSPCATSEASTPD